MEQEHKKSELDTTVLNICQLAKSKMNEYFAVNPHVSISKEEVYNVFKILFSLSNFIIVDFMLPLSSSSY